MTTFDIATRTTDREWSVEALHFAFFEDDDRLRITERNGCGAGATRYVMATNRRNINGEFAVRDTTTGELIALENTSVVTAPSRRHFIVGTHNGVVVAGLICTIH